MPADGYVRDVARATVYPGAEKFLPDSEALPDLVEAAETCRGCDLYARATQTVFGAGPRSARLVLVGEQPGDVEDRRGEPFVGRRERRSTVRWTTPASSGRTCT